MAQRYLPNALLTTLHVNLLGKILPFSFAIHHSAVKTYLISYFTVNLSFFIRLAFYNFVIFSFCSNCYAFPDKTLNEAYSWKVKKVIDGDTIKIAETFGLPSQLSISVRIKNVDTPEKSPKAKCAKEAKLAQLAYEFTKNAFDEAVRHNRRITFSEIEWDKYGGRILAVVKIENRALAQDLIKNGLGREYHGRKKPNWCK